MITKTTNLGSAYTELFTEINRQAPALNIHSLEEFFGHIVEIKALNQKYLRLPLDEPMFEIDANSRTIAIPDAFKKNGVSVQNDHLAETLFFKIDRYFDYMDLLSLDIAIKWKIGNQQGISSNFIKSGDIEAGCVVFGWPIHDDITVKSGTLTFAISFMKKDADNNITYSFNTSPTSLSIKEGLNLEGTVETFDMSNNLVSILSNSSFGEGEAAVDDITWITQLHKADADYVASLNLDFTAEDTTGENVVSADLYATACAGAGAIVNYYNADNELLSGTNIEYLAVAADSELNNKVKYYKASGDAYVEATQADLDAWGGASQVSLYMKSVKISATGVGNYIVKAQGIKQIQYVAIATGTTLSNDVTYYKIINGAYVVAEEADRDKWGTANAVALYIQSDSATEGSVTVTIGTGNMKPSSSVTVPAPEAISEVSFTATQTLEPASAYSFDEVHPYYVDADHAVSFSADVADSYGKVKYILYKDNEATDTASDVQLPSVAYAISNITAAGKYKVKAQHFRNSAAADVLAESSEIEVSELASAFTVNEPEDDLKIVQLNKTNNAVTNVEFTLANAVANSEGFITELYSCEDNDGNNKALIEGQTANATFDTESNILVCPITYKVTTRPVTENPSNDGYYCFKISNKYNKSYYAQYSPVFYLNKN